MCMTYKTSCVIDHLVLKTKEALSFPLYRWGNVNPKEIKSFVLDSGATLQYSFVGSHRLYTLDE